MTERRYGDDNTIHRTGEVNVEVDKQGKVVSVWFRCMPLPFDQEVVDEVRAEEMRRMYKGLEEAAPKHQIKAIVTTDTEPDIPEDPAARFSQRED